MPISRQALKSAEFWTPWRTKTVVATCEFRRFSRNLAKHSDQDETAKQSITANNRTIWRLSHGSSCLSMKNGESPARAEMFPGRGKPRERARGGGVRRDAPSSGAVRRKKKEGRPHGRPLGGEKEKSRRRPTLARARPALPSAKRPLTSVFGMGTGMATSLWPPAEKP